MPLETATWISDLNSSNPDGADAKSQGDNHLRLIKSVLKNHFPALVTSSGTDAITVTYSPAWTEYKPGVLVMFKAGGTNTGAATFNANSLGAIAIQCGGAALRAGAISADDMFLGIIRDVSGTKTVQMISFNRSPAMDNVAINIITANAGTVQLSASISGGATFRIPHGATPSSPVDGDMWSISSGAFLVRGAGATWQLNHINTNALMQLTLAADKLPYATGVNSMALADLSAFARTLLDDAAASDARATLGVKSMATRDVTISTSNPSGGADGDVWLKYTP